jgi:hypothetical protein
LRAGKVTRPPSGPSTVFEAAAPHRIRAGERVRHEAHNDKKVDQKLAVNEIKLTLT